MTSSPLLRVAELQTHFFVRRGTVRAVDGVSFHIDPGEIFGLVGESGCGKTVTALSIMQLVPQPPGRIVGGQILFDGDDLLQKREEEMRKVRGGRIAMIFQDPLTSLNPVLRVGTQMAEALHVHGVAAKEQIRAHAIRMLRDVGLPDPEYQVDRYPFQLSGGMRQRVMIAIALSTNPTLLIADEPTTNLDVTVQAQILELIKSICARRGTSVLLITHNMGIVAWVCDRVGVMYAGQIVELGKTLDVFRHPLHPYTMALLRSIPRVDVLKERLDMIAGEVPDLVHPPAGCHFHPRCGFAKPICQRREVPMFEPEPGHFVRCLMHEGFPWD